MICPHVRGKGCYGCAVERCAAGYGASTRCDSAVCTSQHVRNHRLLVSRTSVWKGADRPSRLKSMSRFLTRERYGNETICRYYWYRFSGNIRIRHLCFGAARYGQVLRPWCSGSVMWAWVLLLSNKEV